MRVSCDLVNTIKATADISLVDIVVHTASSRFPTMVSYMIKALGQRRQVSGKETYFIHVSQLDPADPVVN